MDRRTRILAAGALVVLSFVLASAAHPPGASAQAPSTRVELDAGGNFVPYIGAALPVEQALGDALDAVTALWAFDSTTATWSGWNPSLPPALQGLTSLEHRVPYFVFADRAATWVFPLLAPLAAVEQIDLRAGGNPLIYPWPTAPIEQALGTVLEQGQTVWRFRAGAWQSWDSRLPVALRDFDTLERGAVYWLEAGSAIGWAVEETPEMTALGAVLDQVVQPDENFHDLIVFLHPTLLQPGDEVRPAFPDDLGEGGLAVEAPSYVFWIDHAPMAYFAKPNQFALVDAETFAVTESAEMFWPLLNGVGLFTDAAAYRDPCNWAFARFDALGPPPQLGTPAGQAAARGLRVSQFDGLPSQICGLVVDGGAAGEPSRADMAASAAIMAMALTDFGYTRVDTVGPPNNTPAAFEAAIRDISMRPGCEQITIYVTAHAATDTLILGGQEYSAAAFAVHLEGASPLDFFNVILDTSRAGTFRDDLSVIERRGVPKVTFIATETGLYGWAYGDIDPPGGPVGPDGVLIAAAADPEDVGGVFTNAIVAGLAAVSSDEEAMAGPLSVATGGAPPPPPPDTSIADAEERRLAFQRALVDVFRAAALIALESDYGIVVDEAFALFLAIRGSEFDEEQQDLLRDVVGYVIVFFG